MRSSHLISTVLLFSSLSRLSGAQASVTPARALFDEGRALAAKGDFVAACPKFEQSLALEGGVGTQFNLADCWERTGRLASARALFLGAAASAKAAGQAEREQVLRDRATALEPRLSKLVIEVEATDAKLTVKRDALPLEPDSFGKAVAVDPGTYTISAKAPGKKSWSQTVEVERGRAGVVTVAVPVLEAEETDQKRSPAPTQVAQPKARRPLPEPRARTPNERSLNYKALGLGAFGLGAAAVGTVMAFRYKSANDEAASICPTSRMCSPDEINQHGRAVDRATLSRTWSYVGFGVGGAAVVGATALLILQPYSESETPLRATPQLSGSGVFGATIDGSF